jgi:(R,R)-butanediol dehydrogenase/meso-butanediol dehydrogenase/diacetyl reductase
MKAAVFTESKTIQTQQVPKPKAGPGEAVVKVEYCGICGSEVSAYAQGTLPPGAIVGHELAGTVDEVGPGTEEWQGGDRVVATAYAACGDCYWCRHGQVQLCQRKYWIGLGFNPGAFAEYCKVRSSMLHRIPQQLSLRDAALVEPLAVALHAVRNAHVNLGDKVAIIGMGPVGLLVLQVMKLAGAGAVAVIEIAARRLALAKDLGASLALRPEEATVAVISEALGTLPGLLFDCAGATSSLQLAADLVCPQGKIILVGLSPKPVPIIAKEWSRKEITLQASMAYGEEFPLAVHLIADGKITAASLISDVITLEELDHTLKNLVTPNDQLKVLVHL